MVKLTHADVISALVARGVPVHVAQGVAMNFQDESGLETGIQEAAPTRGRGGFGLAQWTGPRRVALEDFARSTGRSVDDPEAQYDFFMRENAGPEAGAWKAVMNSPDAQTAAVNFVTKWERPASKYAASRSAKYQGAIPDDLVWDEKGMYRAGNPPSPAGRGAGGTATASTGQSAAPGDTKQPQEYAQGLADSLGQMAGSDLGNPRGPGVVPMGKPVAAPTLAEPGTVLSPEMINAQRQKLAMALARLNSGQLFAG